MPSFGQIVLIVLVLLAIVTVMKGVRTVPQGEVWTVQRFGAFTHLLQPGLNFIVPYIDTVGHRMNVQEVVLDIPEQSVITRDNATVNVDGIVYYRVMDPAKAAYAVQNLTAALAALSMTNIRAVIGEMDLDQTLSSRDRINSQLLGILDGATDPWGVKIARVEILQDVVGILGDEADAHAWPLRIEAAQNRRDIGRDDVDGNAEAHLTFEGGCRHAIPDFVVERDDAPCVPQQFLARWRQDETVVLAIE